jgi:4-diphosphocytidyl-2-C-methyl-D-erythritol kinase
VLRTLEVTAHAKINLTLRVIGRRADGLHLLDGITGFSAFGDRIRVGIGDTDDTLRLTGPFAAKVEGKNIVTTALDRYRAATGLAAGVAVEIEKNIPVAAGLGGGSCDAGAVLRVLQEVAAAPMDNAALHELALSIGADVPVCLACRSFAVQGIGERLVSIGPLPRCLVLLVNPGVPLSAGSVFGDFRGPYSAPASMAANNAPAERPPSYMGVRAYNDLMEAAIYQAPVISEVLAALSSLAGARSTGMSGSGATCFALFAREDRDLRDAAAEKMRARGWWSVGTELRP